MFELELRESWEGRILVSRLDRAESSIEVHLIGSDAEYEAFLERLPKRRIQMRQPAPPSDDPMLRKPVLDFSREVLVVAVRRDSMYVGPRIIGAFPDGGILRVNVELPSLAESGAYAARSDVGMYQAVRVNRVEGVVGIELSELMGPSHVG